MCFPDVAKIIKENNFNSKLYSGHLEQLNSVFKERFAQLCEIKPVRS
jgi:hypothetical protein